MQCAVAGGWKDEDNIETKASEAVRKGQGPTLEGEPGKLRDRGGGLVVHPAVVLLLVAAPTGRQTSGDAFMILKQYLTSALL